MSEYTPTTQQIRDSYRSHDTLQAAAAGFSWEERGDEFDRWLAAHDREVAARAVEAARDAIMPPVNWNLNPDGSEQRGTAVMDGVYHDVHRELSGYAAALRSGTEGSGR